MFSLVSLYQTFCKNKVYIKFDILMAKAKKVDQQQILNCHIFRIRESTIDSRFEQMDQQACLLGRADDTHTADTFYSTGTIWASGLMVIS